MRYLLTVLFLFTFLAYTFGQETPSSRSTMYFTMGRTGTVLREFNQMLDNKGLSPMRKGYTNFNFGYQARYNDFILGLELFQNPGPKSIFNGYEIDYRTTRFNVNVGFSFTEEGPFQLIHYMSVGSGFLNFQMLRENEVNDLDSFLQSPERGFILRDGNMHKSSLNLSGFLTEIGFQLSYDLPIPGRDEALALMARFGYSFSPFENSWNVSGMSFNSTQAGAFLRLGAGITLPDYKYFYKDASLGAHIIYGLHFTSPDVFNEHLVENGLQPFTGKPNNWGLKVLGYSKQLMYGMDFFNLGLGGKASDTQTHSLNSVRVYANAGFKFLDLRNLEIGTLTGIGFGNLRYTITSDIRPDFPRLFEEPDHDGYLAAYGAMLKPEAFITYGIPLSQKNFMDLIIGLHAGYELPVSQYKLADLAMFKYMANPYLQFSVGFRP